MKRKHAPAMRPVKARHCDYPGCTATDAKRLDIETNHFRGDDIVMNACPEHRKAPHHRELLQTEKARKQF